MNARVFSPNEWVYADTDPATGSAGPVHLFAARGGRTACQVLAESSGYAGPVRFRAVTDAGIGPPPVEVFELRDVKVEKNTGLTGFVARENEDPSEYVTRRAPFRVFDAMRPAPDGACEVRNGKIAAYLSWRIPADAEPGTVCGRILVETANGGTEIPLTLHVSPAIVPDPGRLQVTNWFSLDNMASRHGLEQGSEAHWAMIGRYADLMRRGRQNHFWVPLRTVGIARRDDGRYVFDFSRVERLVTLFLDRGFTVIEGGHVGSRRHFGDAAFVLSIDSEIPATGPEGYAFLAQYLPAWREFLRERGWLDRLIQYVGDEPIDSSAQDYRVLAGIVRKFLPGVPLIDAVERPGLGGAVDIWVPKNSYYQGHREEFERHRSFGDTLWFYTCCIPGGKFTNRLLDMPLLRTRYLHWGNYRYALDGYLHWGFNHYKSSQDPFEENAPAHGEGGTTNLPPGDTHIVYPGPDSPWPSVRLEAMAMGVEDYELLRIVAAARPDLADSICSSVFHAFDDVEEDPELFDAAHRRLLQAAAACADN